MGLTIASNRLQTRRRALISSKVVPKSFMNYENINGQSSDVATEQQHAYLGNDALMYLDWKVHEGERVLLRNSQARSDGTAFVAREFEFHVDNEEVFEGCWSPRQSCEKAVR